MLRLFQPFFVLLATATDRELARMIQYLKVENQVLRGKLPQRITVTPRERRRLVKYGRAVGPALKDLITIVSPRTFARWLNGEKPPAKKTTRKPGRPRTEAEIRDLVLRIARETGWGYTRILGELKKLGVRAIAWSTVVNILKENGLDPGPPRGEDSWAAFVKRHAATLWACDFFSQKVWTAGGRVDVFVLFFLHVGTRRVHVAGLTAHPDRAWVARQAREALTASAAQGLAVTHLVRDHDSKFTPAFDAAFAVHGVKVKPVGPLAPNLNAYAERWVQSIRQEGLDHFVVFGQAHLPHLIAEYVDYYHRQRPHQAVGNRTLMGAHPPVGHCPADEIVCEERLGGLLKHYHRRAA
jgi:putative transposase